MVWNNQIMDSKKAVGFLILMSCALLLGSCYSFTGASIPPHLNRIHIPNFQDKSGAGVSNLKEDLTQLVTNKITTQSSLELSTVQSADCVLEGNIKTYTNQPFLVSGAASNTKRVTIRVEVSYRDLVKKQTIWTQEFESWGEYLDSGTEAEGAAAKDALTKISDEIFSKVVSSW